jgi:hypothetical protein
VDTALRRSAGPTLYRKPPGALHWCIHGLRSHGPPATFPGHDCRVDGRI